MVYQINLGHRSIRYTIMKISLDMIHSISILIERIKVIQLKPNVRGKNLSLLQPLLCDACNRSMELTTHGSLLKSICKMNSIRPNNKLFKFSFNEYSGLPLLQALFLCDACNRWRIRVPFVNYKDMNSA